MPAGKSHKGVSADAPVTGGDCIGAFPDEILHRVLSFLPAVQAVQTYVLAWRWLNLWKYVTVLRIIGADGKAPAPYADILEFVDSLLLLRKPSLLETFEVSVVGNDTIDIQRIRLWVKYALQFKVQKLLLNIQFRTHKIWSFWPEDPPFASRYLTFLVLRKILFNHEFLDFSRCPALQHLEIEDCSFIDTQVISSQSLKHLSIKTGSFNDSFRTRIRAPNLAFLGLQVYYGRTPLLERMPMLVSASVGMLGTCKDWCRSSHSNYGDCGDESYGCSIKDDSTTIVLCGISKAKTLVLGTNCKMFIFRRDLKWCPTFSRLKVLVLTEWCVRDVHGLACILEHSPVLQDLYFHIFFMSQGCNVKMKGRINPKEVPPIISSHIKRVEVVCGVIDERLIEFFKFLRGTLNISMLANNTLVP